jgi:hypothetical protein
VPGEPHQPTEGVGGPVRAVGVFDNQMPGVQKFMNDFKARFNDDWYTGQTYTEYLLFTGSVQTATLNVYLPPPPDNV